ncbi:MAG: hypothetical protein KDB04_03980 [Acidimicrobiales bacterium]|nr:hypothetical protein [Acidimicrobiales bacterium]
MAQLSFRDRFFSPPVARALTSPSGILALGAGAAVGVLATLATGGLAGPIIGGVVGGLVGYSGRIALALPPKGTGPRIDPFGVDEPWRHAVRDAVHARNRFREAVRTFRSGPLQDTVRGLGDQLDQAVEEVWAVAQQGQQVAEARKRIDDREIRWELQRAASQIPPGAAATPVQEQTVEALNEQLASGARMDAIMRSTFDELNLLNARLDQAVTQAIELSVTNREGGFAPVGSDVRAIVDQLGALHQAMSDLDGPTASTVESAPPSDQEAPRTAPPATGPTSPTSPPSAPDPR